MPHTATLPNTEAITLDSGEWAAIAALREKSGKDKKERLIREKQDEVKRLQESVKAFFIARVQVRAAHWQKYYDNVAAVA